MVQEMQDENCDKGLGNMKFKQIIHQTRADDDYFGREVILTGPVISNHGENYNKGI